MHFVRSCAGMILPTIALADKSLDLGHCLDKFNENHENLQNSFEKQAHKKIMNYASCVKLCKHDFTTM